jgi:excisionase family DNA binding protein
MSASGNLTNLIAVTLPADQNSDVATFSRQLVKMREFHKRPPKFEIVGPDGEHLRLPAALYTVLVRVAAVMAQGDGVSVVPVAREMTTQQAAELLNVSRQYVVRLLDENKIPHTRMGSQARSA